jgi:hypothetical protein
MAGFEKVGGLIRQLNFTSAEKGALGALQVVSIAQPIVDKWVVSKFGDRVVVRVVAFKAGVLKLETRNASEVVEVRKNSRGLILRLNRSLSFGLVKSLNIKAGLTQG